MQDKHERRVYTAFPQNVSAEPRPRHGRELDATREKITRPTDATPRRAADWR